MVKIDDRITFKAEEQKGETIILSFVNDFTMHKGIQKVASNFMDKSLSKPDERVASGFYHLFERIAKYISCTDIAFANLETPLAKNLTSKTTFDSKGRYITIEKKELPEDVLYDVGTYDFFPYNFNVHPAFALALKKVGFKIVNTANNHAADRLSNGIDKTIDSLDRYDIDHTGTVFYNQIMENQSKNIWDFKPYVIKEVKGIKIAFFSAAQFMNKSWDKSSQKTEKYGQVYKLGKGLLYGFNGRNIPRLLKWIKEARDVDNVDIIIIYLHWGLNLFAEKDGHSPDLLQKIWGKKLLEGGADIIVGGHTHTLQLGKKYITKDGRETFVVYSLGNFLTDYTNPNKVAAAILYITLVKNEKGTFIKKIKYLPTYSLMKKEEEEIVDLQVVPVDKYENLYHLSDHYNRIFGKHNLVTYEDIEKEYGLK